MLPVRRLRALHAAVPPDATPPHGGTCCTPRAERGLDVLVRSDSAGASHDFVSAIVSRGFEFSVGFDITEPVREAILKLPGGSWVAPITKEMEEAEVAEVNGLLDVSKRPKGARVLVRREQPHPGATYNLFDPNRLCPQALLTNSQDPTSLTWRHATAFTPGWRPRSNAPRMRPGELPLPQLPGQPGVALPGPAGQEPALLGQTALPHPVFLLARPKPVRYQLLQVAGRLVHTGRRSSLRLDARWPWAKELELAFTRLRSLPISP